MSGLIIKLAQDRLTRKRSNSNFNPVQRDLIEMGPKKWSKQGAFMLSRQRNNKSAGK